ncbi:hypothetical protein [Stutzerimonas stutzeri]|uniref:hypothetical protein n=1 Tax=Stutzerimonas stutzeri TaxID=316 RepID=UPI0024B7E13C|nr:hypothetical protein [Stutzerimonas stutzeri]MDI9728291.1 hypothetical protein [Stutzerimonas stutzeri]MDI9749131.1 hypothetical protein [Stutzerimonas stutzeri]
MNLYIPGKKKRPSPCPPTFVKKIDAAATRKSLILIWVISILIQCAIWPSSEGLFAALLVLTGGILGINICLRRKIFLNNPISSLTLTGYLFYYFIFPPIVTLLEGKPLTNNLDNPNLVFTHATVCLIAILLAHYIYRHSKLLAAQKLFFQRKIYNPLGFYTPPSNLQLMLIGLIGLSAMTIQTFISGAAQGIATGAGDRLLQGFYGLSYVPYCILVRPLIGGDQKIQKHWPVILMAYTALLLIVAMGSNSRSHIFIGIMSALLAYSYGIFSGLISKNTINTKKLISAGIALLILSGPATDLATSMVIVRDKRTDISALDLAAETFRTFQDKESIRIATLLYSEKKSDWDERYVDNLFFSRLSNLKFTDNSVTLAENLTPGQAEYLRSIEWQRVISVLPSPVISALGLSTNKEFVTSGSGGDFLYAISTGNGLAIGGFRTGSIFGSGYAMFNWFYPIILFLICLLTFPLADSLVKVTRNHTTKILTFNCLTIATLFSWFFYFTSAANGIESMSELSNYLIRGWIQTLIIYSFAYWITRALLTKPFKHKHLN